MFSVRRFGLSVAGLASVVAAAHAGLRITGFDVGEAKVSVSIAAGHKGAAVELFRSPTLDGAWTRAAAGIADGTGALHFICPVEANAASGYYRAAISEDSDGDGLTDVYETLVLHTDAFATDTDGDLLPDGWEVEHGLDPRNSIGEDGAFGDPDEDGVKNVLEFRLGLDPNLYDVCVDTLNHADWFAVYGNNYEPVFGPDSDEDGLPDDWELRWGFDPNDPVGENGPDGDPDDDWLTNLEEFQYGTDPWMRDTDGDGIGDWDEIYVYDSNPFQGDSDKDGLTDYEETAIYGTDPTKWDSDGDGLTDWDELFEYWTNPLSAEDDADGDGLTDEREMFEYHSDAWSEDTDRDGMPDGWELAYGLDVLANDAGGDGDHDGLYNLTEFRIGTRPDQPDTDGDSLHDGWEYKCTLVRAGKMSWDGGEGLLNEISYRTLMGIFDWLIPDMPCTKDNRKDENLDNDPEADPDGDGISNRDECILNLNPGSADTDGDGVADNEELKNGSDPGDKTDAGEPGTRPCCEITFGDPSDSSSEKYYLVVKPVQESGPGEEPRTFGIVNSTCGSVESVFLPLKPEWKYQISLSHAGTDMSQASVYYNLPDYDYQLDVDKYVHTDGSIDGRWKIEVDNPDGLLGTDGTSDYFAGSGKSAYCKISLKPIEATIAVDMNGDKVIDQKDEKIMGYGQPFRFWINGDHDDEAAENGISAQSTDDWAEGKKSGRDCDDDEVNGLRDLVDFAVVRIGAREVNEDRSVLKGWLDHSDGLTIWLSQADSAVNVVWTLGDATFSSHIVGIQNGCGCNLDKKNTEAEVVKVTAKGVALPKELVANVFSPQGCTILLEGCAETTESLHVEFRFGDAPIATTDLNMKISPVDQMYRWVNLRSLLNDDRGRQTNVEVPKNAINNGEMRHFVFVHGYNVNEKQAEGWSAEVFKRLWQSGLRGSYTAVDWYGDESQTWNLPKLGRVSLNFYANVEHAFASASMFSEMVGKLPGEKIVIAHSLGGMLLASSVSDYSLCCTSVFVNAAIAQEAFYGKTNENVRREMILSEWRTRHERYFASNWSQNFQPEDFRSTLTWRDRFRNYPNAITYYSPSDEVTGNPSGTDALLSQPVWPLQELAKGADELHLSDILMFLSPINCEGGWGLNDDYEGDKMPEEDLVTMPLFRKFKDERLHQKALLQLTGEEAQALRARVLADGIPALSFSIGANGMPVEAGGDSRNLEPCAAAVVAWPKDRIIKTKAESGAEPKESRVWHHSDIRDLPYAAVYKFYDELMTIGKKQEEE